QHLVDILRVHIQSLIELVRQFGRVGQSAAQLYDRGVHVRAILTDQLVNVIQRLVGLGCRFLEVVQQRFELGGNVIQMRERRFNLGTVLFEHSARVCQRGGEVGAILRTEQIVHAVDGDSQLGGAIVQGMKQVAGFR